MSGQGLLAVGVPPQPLWLLYIKIAILVLSLIVLALAAYGLSLFNGLYIGGGGAPGMDIFIAIFSFIIYGGAIAIELRAPHLFYRIGALIGNILSIIFWLSAWAWSASTASAWLSVSAYYGVVYTGDKNFGGAMAGCAAMGAIAWILAIVNNVFFIRASIIGTGVSGQAELGQVKAGEVPQQQYQQPYAQQQQYPVQQPYPAQQPGPYPSQ